MSNPNNLGGNNGPVEENAWVEQTANREIDSRVEGNIRSISRADSIELLDSFIDQINAEEEKLSDEDRERRAEEFTLMREAIEKRRAELAPDTTNTEDVSESSYKGIDDMTLTDIATSPDVGEESSNAAMAEIERRQAEGTFDLDHPTYAPGKWEDLGGIGDTELEDYATSPDIDPRLSEAAQVELERREGKDNLAEDLAKDTRVAEKPNAETGNVDPEVSSRVRGNVHSISRADSVELLDDFVRQINAEEEKLSDEDREKRAKEFALMREAIEKRRIELAPSAAEGNNISDSVDGKNAEVSSESVDDNSEKIEALEKELQQVARDMRAAKENGNDDEYAIARSEYSRITEEINELRKEDIAAEDVSTAVSEKRTPIINRGTGETVGWTRVAEKPNAETSKSEKDVLGVSSESVDDNSEKIEALEKELQRVARDMQVAKENGDDNEYAIARSEYSRIVAEIYELKKKKNNTPEDVSVAVVDDNKDKAAPDVADDDEKVEKNPVAAADTKGEDAPIDGEDAEYRAWQKKQMMDYMAMSDDQRREFRRSIRYEDDKDLSGINFDNEGAIDYIADKYRLGEDVDDADYDAALKIEKSKDKKNQESVDDFLAMIAKSQDVAELSEWRKKFVDGYEKLDDETKKKHQEDLKNIVDAIDSRIQELTPKPRKADVVTEPDKQVSAENARQAEIIKSYEDAKKEFEAKIAEINAQLDELYARYASDTGAEPTTVDEGAGSDSDTNTDGNLDIEDGASDAISDSGDVVIGETGADYVEDDAESTAPEVSVKAPERVPVLGEIIADDDSSRTRAADAKATDKLKAFLADDIAEKEAKENKVDVIDYVESIEFKDGDDLEPYLIELEKRSKDEPVETINRAHRILQARFNEFKESGSLPGERAWQQTPNGIRALFETGSSKDTSYGRTIRDLEISDLRGKAYEDVFEVLADLLRDHGREEEIDKFAEVLSRKYEKLGLNKDGSINQEKQKKESRIKKLGNAIKRVLSMGEA